MRPRGRLIFEQRTGQDTYRCSYAYDQLGRRVVGNASR
jgi:hypothetical protein